MIVASGVKNWLLIRPIRPRNGLGRFLAGLSNLSNVISGFSDWIQSETIHLHPGDLL